MFEDLAKRASDLLKWMEEETCSLKEVLKGHRERVYTGESMMETLQFCCFRDEEDLKKVKSSLNDLDAWSKSLTSLAADSTYISGFLKHFRTNCQALIHDLEQLTMVMTWLYENNGQNVADFRLIATQMIPQRKHIKPTEIDKYTTIAIKCLNAAFIFNEIKEDCSSLILTSGTLSPLSAFASDMNVSFKYTIEALSSIDVRKQV